MGVIAKTMQLSLLSLPDELLLSIIECCCEKPLYLYMYTLRSLSCTCRTLYHFIQSVSSLRQPFAVKLHKIDHCDTTSSPRFVSRYVQKLERLFDYYHCSLMTQYTFFFLQPTRFTCRERAVVIMRHYGGYSLPWQLNAPGLSSTDVQYNDISKRYYWADPNSTKPKTRIFLVKSPTKLDATHDDRHKPCVLIDMSTHKVIGLTRVSHSASVQVVTLPDVSLSSGELCALRAWYQKLLGDNIYLVVRHGNTYYSKSCVILYCDQSYYLKPLTEAKEQQLLTRFQCQLDKRIEDLQVKRKRKSIQDIADTASKRQRLKSALRALELLL